MVEKRPLFRHQAAQVEIQPSVQSEESDDRVTGRLSQERSVQSSRRSQQAQEASARTREVQAAIARRLRDDYDLSEPIPDRLAELLRLLEKQTGDIDSEQQSIS